MDAEIDTETGTTATAGFTLIELMIVVAVISILSLSISLSLSRGRSATGLPDDAALIVNQFAQLRDTAIHSRRAAGLSIRPQGWQIMRQTDGRWQGTGPRVRWRGAAVFSRDLSAPAPETPGGPEVYILPDGRTSAFAIRFSQRGNSVRCATDGWTPLACDGP